MAEESVANFAALREIAEREARQEVTRRDAERADFVEYNFHRRVDEAASYDLILNSATFSLEEMVRLVLQAYEMKFRRLPARA